MAVLSGCAHQERTPSAIPAIASHKNVDAAVAAVRLKQKEAERKVTVIEKGVTDPVLKQSVIDLHSTITDLGFSLNDATAKITWYEGQYTFLYSDDKKTHGERDWFETDDNKHIAGESFWRKRAQVILYALALAFAWKFYGSAKHMCVTPIPNLWESVVIPLAAALLGAAIGYAFGLYVLGWIARFLP